MNWNDDRGIFELRVTISTKNYTYPKIILNPESPFAVNPRILEPYQIAKA